MFQSCRFAAISPATTSGAMRRIASPVLLEKVVWPFSAGSATSAASFTRSRSAASSWFFAVNAIARAKCHTPLVNGVSCRGPGSFRMRSHSPKRTIAQ